MWGYTNSYPDVFLAGLTVAMHVTSCRKADWSVCGEIARKGWLEIQPPIKLQSPDYFACTIKLTYWIFVQILGPPRPYTDCATLALHPCRDMPHVLAFLPSYPSDSAVRKTLPQPGIELRSSSTRLVTLTLVFSAICGVRTPGPNPCPIHSIEYVQHFIVSSWRQAWQIDCHVLADRRGVLRSAIKYNRWSF